MSSDADSKSTTGRTMGRELFLRKVSTISGSFEVSITHPAVVWRVRSLMHGGLPLSIVKIVEVKPKNLHVCKNPWKSGDFR